MYDQDDVSNSHYWPVTWLQQHAPERKHVHDAAVALFVKYPIPYN